MSPTDQHDTAEYPLNTGRTDVPTPRVASTLVHADIGALSHQGKVRPNNEDHYLVVQFGRTLKTLATNVAREHVPDRSAEIGYGMLVADGVGGALAGEVASRTAISHMVNLVLETPDWILRIGDPEAEEVMRRAADRFCRIGALLREEAEMNPQLYGMDSTLTVVANVGADMFVANIGDSRAYLLHDGELTQLTRDHTLAQELADRGAIRQEDIATNRLRHVLTRSLATKHGKVKADVHRFSLADQDQVLVCSDGLTDMVDDATIAEIMKRPGSAHDASQALVERALENGGKDNVTVVVARYDFRQEN